MSNTVALALVVVLCAIVVLFSREFGEFGKKLFSLPGVKLVLPLAFASFLVVQYDIWLYFILAKLRTGLLSIIQALSTWFEGYWWAISASILVLLFFSLIPVLALQFWLNRKTYVPFRHAYLLTTTLWLLVATLFVTH